MPREGARGPGAAVPILGEGHIRKRLRGLTRQPVDDDPRHDLLTGREHLPVPEPAAREAFQGEAHGLPVPGIEQTQDMRRVRRRHPGDLHQPAIDPPGERTAVHPRAQDRGHGPDLGADAGHEVGRARL
ncbi:MAG: hypothetical protein ACOCYW_01985 [Roseicyclus sp.]